MTTTMPRTAADADPALRATVLALARWQAERQAELASATLPRLDAGAEAQALARFADAASAARARAAGAAFSTAERAQLDRVAGLLVASSQAQGAVPLQPDASTAGASSHDLARLLHAARNAADEAQQIDAAVRYWEAARRLQLPVDADFGEFWRALEWSTLQHALLALAEAPAGFQAGLDDGAAATARRWQAGLADVTSIALRYGALKPLLRLLGPLSGRAEGAGFTF